MTASLQAESRRPPVSTVLYQDVRRAIVRLELAPGSFIYESALATQYGTSRTPVRAALAQLESDRLIHVLPQRGARVAPLSISVITEAQTVREVLEIESIGRLAGMWDDDQLAFRLVADEFAQSLEEQDKAAESQDFAAFVNLDSAFHSLLMRAAGNATLQRCVESVRLHLQRLRYLELEAKRHEFLSIAQHREIVHAVRANQVETARSLMGQHLSLAADVRDAIYARHSDIFED